MGNVLKVKYFTYHQNNSGGHFYSDDLLSEIVIVEAVDHVHADAIAESIGIYFDGCDTGDDCDCCGDRWERAWSEDGKDEPMYFNKPIIEAFQEDDFIDYFKKEVKVHRMNGDVVHYFRNGDGDLICNIYYRREGVR